MQSCWKTLANIFYSFLNSCWHLYLFFRINYHSLLYIMSSESGSSDREGQFPKGKHKIQLCRSYCEFGMCPYGEMCIFAHGMEELMMYQPALKIKKCRNYHTNGYCRFGVRCNFRHEKNTKPKKKKNLYKFHKIFNGYGDLILGKMIETKNNESACPSEHKNSDSSECSFS